MGWSADACARATTTFGGIAREAELALGVAALDADETATFLSDGCPVDGRFEIGSVTKTMTATLLAGLAHEGAVDLDGEIGRFLDVGPNGAVTPRQLATHTSGLPRLGPDLEARRSRRTGSTLAMRPEEAITALRAAQRAPAGRFEYSNFGYQVLGMVLERAGGAPYAELLEARLLGPLSMRRSGIAERGGGTRLPGHLGRRAVRRVVRPLPAAGGVEATLDDLARYLRACLDPPEDPLGAALRCVQRHQGVRRDASREVGLAWMLRDGGTVLTHTGSTPGFSSAVAVDLRQRQALAVLYNRGGCSMALGAAILLLRGELARSPSQAG